MALQYYVLFHNHTTGLELNEKLKERGISNVIAPTPRSLSRCCGISLLVKEEDIEEIQAIIKEYDLNILEIASIENTHDKFRDKFC